MREKVEAEGGIPTGFARLVQTNYLLAIIVER